MRGHAEGKEQRCGGLRAGGRVCLVLGLEAGQERLEGLPLHPQSHAGVRGPISGECLKFTQAAL